MLVFAFTRRPATPPSKSRCALHVALRARSSRLRALAALVVGIVCTSCDRTVPLTSPAPRVQSAPSLAAVPEIPDRTMGRLSPLALQIVVALRDPALRARLAAFMKSSEGGLLGLSLSDCGANSLADEIFARGENNGVGSAETSCANTKLYAGVVLHMAPERLRAWDGSTIPIVTAIEHPEDPLPTTFLGYRGATQAIELPKDGSVGGPILVLLPYAKRPNDREAKIEGMPQRTLHPAPPTPNTRVP